MAAKPQRVKRYQNSLAIGRFTPYVYILPAVAVLLIMVAYPFVYGVSLSFTDMSLATFKKPNFIGLNNYIELFQDAMFYGTFGRTVFWTVINVFFHVTIGLFLAMLLNRKLPGKTFFRIFLIIPWAMPQYIASLTWRGMFNLQYGLVNILIDKTGIGRELFYFGLIDKYPIPWLNDPQWTFTGAVITNIWLGFPFMMMVCLGALQSINASLYEAADIDGATNWQKFTKITLPLIKPVLTPSIVLGTVWTFNMLNVILILTGGFGNDKTQILVTQVYRQGFNFYRYGYAAAYSVAIFAMLLAFTVTFMKYMKGTEAVE